MTPAEARALNKNFVADISAWVTKAKIAPTLVVRKVLFDMANAVVLRTPVDTGRLRASWQFGTDEIPSAAPAGLESLNELMAATLQAEAGHVHYIVNNLPYASVIEYGLYPNPPTHPTGKTVGGYSTQAPAGMVRITVVEMQQFIAQAVQEVANGR